MAKKSDPFEKFKEATLGSSGTLSGALSNAVTATVDVGGINTGTTFPIGTTYDELWAELLSPTLYPTLTAPSATMTATGDKLLEKGSTLETTMTITFDRGSISPAYGTSGYRSGAASSYSLNSGAAQAGNTFVVTVTESTTSYQASVNYAAGEQPKDSSGDDYGEPLAAGSAATNIINYEFVDALWNAKHEPFEDPDFHSGRPVPCAGFRV